jgi:hypothetical protein
VSDRQAVILAWAIIGAASLVVAVFLAWSLAALLS